MPCQPYLPPFCNDTGELYWALVSDREDWLSATLRGLGVFFFPTAASIWRFPKSSGVPQIINFHQIFPNKNHPAIGVPPFMETPIYVRKSFIRRVGLRSEVPSKRNHAWKSRHHLEKIGLCQFSVVSTPRKMNSKLTSKGRNFTQMVPKVISLV